MEASDVLLVWWKFLLCHDKLALLLNDLGGNLPTGQLVVFEVHHFLIRNFFCFFRVRSRMRQILSLNFASLLLLCHNNRFSDRVLGKSCSIYVAHFILDDPYFHRSLWIDFLNQASYNELRRCLFCMLVNCNNRLFSKLLEEVLHIFDFNFKLSHTLLN